MERTSSWIKPDSQNKSINNMNKQEEYPGWERIRGIVDSGSFDHVGSKELAEAFELEAIAVSEKDEGWNAANGTKIKNHGQRRIAAMIQQGKKMRIAIQIVDVKNCLFSTHQFDKVGLQTIIDGNISCFRHRKTGEIIPLVKERGQYILYLWVPAKKKHIVKNEVETGISTKNPFGVLAETATENEGPFVWLDDLVWKTLQNPGLDL